MKNIMPVIEVKSSSCWGSNYQVPVKFRPENARTALALRWLVNYSRLRGEDLYGTTSS